MSQTPLVDMIVEEHDITNNDAIDMEKVCWNRYEIMQSMAFPTVCACFRINVGDEVCLRGQCTMRIYSAMPHLEKVIIHVLVFLWQDVPLPVSPIGISL